MDRFQRPTEAASDCNSHTIEFGSSHNNNNNDNNIGNIAVQICTGSHHAPQSSLQRREIKMIIIITSTITITSTTTTNNKTTINKRSLIREHDGKRAAGRPASRPQKPAVQLRASNCVINLSLPFSFSWLCPFVVDGRRRFKISLARRCINS